MDLLDWQGQDTQAQELLHLLRSAGVCVQRYDAARHQGPAGVCVAGRPRRGHPARSRPIPPLPSLREKTAPRSGP